MSTEANALLEALDRAIAAASTEDLPALVTALSSKVTAASARLLRAPQGVELSTTRPERNMSAREAAERP